MDEEKIKNLLVKFLNSQQYDKWNSPRRERYQYNHSWISEITSISDDQLKVKFIEYYNGGEGRQSLNKIWRDRIIRDAVKFRSMLVYLLDETVPLQERFSNVTSSDGAKHIEGVGRALASAFLMDLNPQEYCIWNSKTEMGFSVIEWDLPYESSDNEGTKYVKVLEQLDRLREIGAELKINFDDVDFFLHWISAEDEGKKAVEATTSENGVESGLIETGVYFEAPEEKFVQKIIENNFDSVFGPLNLQLYEGDPEQSGAQFSTPAGTIDFLAIDKATSNFVVIELKVGKISDSVVGQILRYVGYVKEYLAKDKEVKGLILAEDIDEKSAYALKLLPFVEFRKYKLNIQIA